MSAAPGRPSAIGGLLLALLLTASVATFAGARALRAQPDIVSAVRLVPLPEDRAARISFRLTEPDADADVLIVDREGSIVRALQTAEPLGEARHRFRWNGLDTDGSPAPAGRYSLRVELREQGRSIEPPGSILLRRAGAPPEPGPSPTIGGGG